VNEEILQLKYLPAGMISELKDSVQPYYYSEDHTADSDDDPNHED
jgi:hypothetical protein